MWRNKKFIVITLLVVLVLVGSTAGVVFAQAEDETGSPPKTLLARVAEILGIDQQTVEDAFAQAQSEMRDEALDSYLQQLVEAGKITQEEADQYKAWWQAKPDMAPFRQQLEEWQQAKPDMPISGHFGGFGSRGSHGGMKWGGGRFFGGR